MEVCEREEFKAECGPDEVILMREAQYGRMRLGRCVKKNYGSLGCAADVLPLLHTLCSGKRTCSFPITALHKPSSGCPAELISYLQAEYDCIKGTPVINPSPRSALVNAKYYGDSAEI